MDTVGKLLERNARFYPHREALVCGSRRHTYRSFYAAVNKLADGLHRLGVRRQDRVAILSMNNAEFVELLAAGDVAGYIVAPLNFRFAAPEVEWVLGDSSPRVLVFEAQYLALVASIKDKLKGIEHWVVIQDGTDVELPSWVMRWEALVASGSEAGPPVRSQPDDFGPLVYTSGTTGRPKGAMRSQRRWIATADRGAAISEFNSDTCTLLTTPAFHVGVIGYLVETYWVAGKVVLHRSFSPEQVLKAIEEERVTFSFFVAAMLQALLDSPECSTRDLSSLQNVVAAGAPCPVPLLQRAVERLGPIFSIQYGATETSGTGLFRRDVNPFGGEREIKRLASVGHPHPLNRLKVVDDAGNECPVGVAGEVCIMAEDQFNGYWNNTAATIESIRDGWYHTGDVGYRDEDGYLYLIDRKKDMIISGGENIYSREVENAVQSHPAVQECAVIGVPDAKWGETVCAVVVCRPGMSVGMEELVVHCKTQIASYKCPRLVEFVAEMPRVTSGKINKVELRQRYAKT